MSTQIRTKHKKQYLVTGIPIAAAHFWAMAVALKDEPYHRKRTLPNSSLLIFRVLIDKNIFIYPLVFNQGDLSLKIYVICRNKPSLFLKKQIKTV
jgi:hypothetical protein